jgi:Putative DNA-binding domain
MTAGAVPRLETLERWMQSVVMHPDGAEAGVRSAPARRLIPAAASKLETVVLPSKSLTSTERLGIYANMYYARLIEVLDAEYPTTRQILGPDAFEAACRKFIARHPSRTRTLGHLSEQFPAFLARHLPRSNRHGLAVDVARIERAMEDVFDARRAEPMTPEQFASIGGDQWERVKLAVTPALRLLTLRFPANAYMNAVRDGAKPGIPRPRPSFAIVYRRGFQVFRRDQAREQFRLLSALAAGRPLGAAVRASAGRGPSANVLAAKLGGWFRDWAAGGIFVAK